jgi:phosphoadenosine phosphosulfate reductase
MYSYNYDPATGGILLNFSPTLFSKEPRPVYAWELDILGFDKYWKYDKQIDLPYMWAEQTNYYYRGILAAKIKGGNHYECPEIIFPDIDNNMYIPDNYLQPIDIKKMVEKNKPILEIIEQATVKKIVGVFEKYKNKLDCFHVAFSGGKDSCVLLELVKKSLPKGSFAVVFGDTGMEFCDTYNIVAKMKEQCAKDEIPFYTAGADFAPHDAWGLFGPPSRALRWCCWVHKSAPQTLKLRQVLSKNNYTGLAFVGVRAHESAKRAEYDYENYGKKQRGQYSYNPILEWTSAEVWLYLYANNVIINDAYKKGSARVGCICCPMGSGGKSSYIEHRNYTAEVESYFELIKKSNARKNMNVSNYIKSGGWSARNNGRDLANNPNKCLERIEEGDLIIDVINPSSDWRQWIKTINLPDSKYSIKETKMGYTAKLKGDFIREQRLMGKLFRQVFRKAAYCKGCRVCQANCPNGSLEFTDNKVYISGCTQCAKCHLIDGGCLLYYSLRQPQGEFMPVKSLNTMSNHAPKPEWFRAFFEQKNDFFTNHTLGPNQFSCFKRFLKDADLGCKNSITNFCKLIINIGPDSATSFGLILANLVYANPQIEWYVKNLDIDRVYKHDEVKEMLMAYDVKEDVANSICMAFKRLTQTPLGTSLQWGYVADDKSLARTKCRVDDLRVILYALFKFAQSCDNFKEFTLTVLFDETAKRKGVSPTRIFGFSQKEMKQALMGLSAKYPAFIIASFTHDLQKITLANDKNAEDVLTLFGEDLVNV